MENAASKTGHAGWILAGMIATVGLVGLSVARLHPFELFSGSVEVAETKPKYESPSLDVVKFAPVKRWRQIYVPVVARVFHEGGAALPLDINLILRNPGQHKSLFVDRIELYGKDGKRISSLTEKSFELSAFSSIDFLIAAELPAGAPPRTDTATTPSHVLITWGAQDSEQPLLASALMVASEGSFSHQEQGIDLGWADPTPTSTPPAPSNRNDTTPPPSAPRGSAAGGVQPRGTDPRAPDPESPAYVLVRRSGGPLHDKTP